MTDLQNSLFEAMKAFTNKAEEQSTAAKTIEGIISEVVDAAVGEYKLDYLGNTFTVFSTSNTKYEKDDQVYVLVPNGDFTKNKIILGFINPKADAYVTADENDLYYEVSDNLIMLPIQYPIELSSYKTETVTYKEINGSILHSDYANMINDYIASGFNTFALKVNVKTKFPKEQQVSGNYGVRLRLPLTTQGPNGEYVLEDKEFVVDVGNMSGNPYHNDEWSPQTVYFTIDKNYRVSNIITEEQKASLSFFCYDFIQREEFAEEHDIFFKDVEFVAVDVLSQSDMQGYKLMLKATNGVYFQNNSTFNQDKTITPVLRVNGKLANLEKEDSQIYWFKENVNIKTTSDKYCNYGGRGWECLNPSKIVETLDNGTELKDWVSQSSIVVKQKDVYTESRYKAVIFYKETKVTAEITLKNLASASDFTLSTIDGSTEFIENTGYVNLLARVKIDKAVDQEKYINSVFYSWLRNDRNGSAVDNEDELFTLIRYNEVVDGWLETEVKFPVSRIEDASVFFCTATYVFNNNGVLEEQVIGTRSLGVTTFKSAGYSLFINGDDIIYKYDTDGDSPAGTAYDGPSTSKVNSIEPLTFTVRKPDGSELSAEEYAYVHYKWIVPGSSMFTIKSDSSPLEGYADVGNNIKLFYTIANRFNTTKAAAMLNLEVTFNDVVLRRTANISFIKEGMNGTNGTQYAARLVWGGLDKDSSVPYAGFDEDTNSSPDARRLAKKLKFVYNIGNGNLYFQDYDDNELKVYRNSEGVGEKIRKIFTRVYENSEEITDFEVSYEMFDKKITNPCLAIDTSFDVKNGVVFKLDKVPASLDDIYCNILQAKIKVKYGNDSETKAYKYLYVYYPIEFAITDIDDIHLIPTIDGGYGEVMYATDGTNPAWDETSPFKVNPSVYYGISNTEDFFDISWDAKNNFIQKTIPEDGVFEGYIKPNNKYDNGNCQNYVKTTLVRNDIQSTYETYVIQENIENDLAKVEQYENTETYINDIKTISWDMWLDSISAASNMLAERVKLFNSLNRLLDDSFYQDIDLTTQINKEIESLKAEAQEAKDILYTLNKETVELKHIDTVISKLSTDGNAVNITLNYKIDDINDEVKRYNDAAAAFKFSTELILVQSVYNNILSIANVEHENVLPQYEETAKVLELYPDKFASQSSEVGLNSVILELVNTILANLNNPVILTSLQNQLVKIKEEIADLTEKLNNYKAITNLPLGATINYIRPIVFYFNTYSMSNINGWDGNKIYTGDNDEYLLAPQVGAGRKNDDNTFTGMVMGLRQSNKDDKQDVGLFGYSNGTQSIFLDANTGSATFGKSNGGQIIIKPDDNEAIIKSGNYENGVGGLLIDLSTPEIKFGSGNFSVTKEGYLTAKGGGTIAGWTIHNDYLSNADNTLRLSSNGTISGGKDGGNSWAINNDGFASFNNISITGGWIAGGPAMGSAKGFKIIWDDGSYKIVGCGGNDSYSDGRMEIQISSDGYMKGFSQHEGTGWCINARGLAQFTVLQVRASNGSTINVANDIEYFHKKISNLEQTVKNLTDYVLLLPTS